jgi:hypothetical protein
MTSAPPIPAITTKTLSKLDKVTMLGLTVYSMGIWWIILSQGAYVAAGFMFASLPLLMAAVVLTKVRWIPAVLGVIAAVLMPGAMTSPAQVARLTHPEIIVPFMQGSLEVVGLAVAVVAGIVATIQHYRLGGGMADGYGSESQGHTLHADSERP